MVRAVAAVACVALAGCGVGVNCTPTTGQCQSTEGAAVAYTGDIGIERVIYGCCDGETAAAGTCGGVGEWWFDLRVTGTAQSATVTMSTELTGPWTEVHDLDLIDRDGDGWWEIHYGEWSIADTSDCGDRDACADLYTASTVSILTCSADELNSLRYTVELRDATGTRADCVTWGADSPEAPSGCEDAVTAGVL